MAVPSATASTFGSGTFGSCQFGSCSISLATDGLVTLDVTPDPVGSCTVQNDEVSVLTDNSNGYTLSLSSQVTSTDLTYLSNSIPASTAGQASPQTLPNNRWGYRVDDFGNFGAGPTSSQTNAPAPSTTFAGILPIEDASGIIATTSTAANPAVETLVWYGVCADTDTISGLYTATALYTAIAN